MLLKAKRKKSKPDSVKRGLTKAPGDRVLMMVLLYSNMMTEDDIKIAGNCITLPNGISRVFQHEIWKYIVHRDMVFVLLSYPAKDSFGNNIFALDREGNIRVQ